MTLSVGNEVRVVKQTDWSKQPGHTYITDIEALNLPANTQGIGAGNVFVQQKSSSRWWVSSGFSICSGVVMHTKHQGFTFTHIQPGNDVFFYHLDKLGKQQARRTLVIVLGTESDASPQTELAKLAVKGHWGPIEVSTINVDTGRTQWGVVLDTKTGLIRVVRKTPTHTILDYRPKW